MQTFTFDNYNVVQTCEQPPVFSYLVTLKNGLSLPSFLSFPTYSSTFTVNTSNPLDLGTYSIKVKGSEVLTLYSGYSILTLRIVIPSYIVPENTAPQFLDFPVAPLNITAGHSYDYVLPTVWDKENDTVVIN